MMYERRKQDRMPSFLGGRIRLRYLHSTLDCLIRNISPAGGRVVLSAPVVLPANVELEITARDETRRGRVVWRNDLHVGIEFDQTPRNVEPVSLAMARKIKNLEAEKAALKRRVEDLSGE